MHAFMETRVEAPHARDLLTVPVKDDERLRILSVFSYIKHTPCSKWRAFLKNKM